MKEKREGKMEKEVRDIEARRQIEIIKEVLATLLDEKSKETRLGKIGKTLSKFPTIEII